MPINAVAGVLGVNGVKPVTTPTNNTQATGNFGQTVVDALQNLQDTQSSADNLALKAATGDLTDVHNYMIAATEASVQTELTVAVRNKAVDAFNSIMQMQV
jgi:flagellar hook-basal body complex protein FliE